MAQQSRQARCWVVHLQCGRTRMALSQRFFFQLGSASQGLATPVAMGCTLCFPLLPTPSSPVWGTNQDPIEHWRHKNQFQYRALDFLHGIHRRSLSKWQGSILGCYDEFFNEKRPDFSGKYHETVWIPKWDPINISPPREPCADQRTIFICLKHRMISFKPSLIA